MATALPLVLAKVISLLLFKLAHLLWTFTGEITTNQKEIHSTPLLLNPCTITTFDHSEREDHPNELIWWLVTPSLQPPAIPIKTYYVPNSRERDSTNCEGNSNTNHGEKCASESRLSAIQVHEMNARTMHMVPHFYKVGFEFVDIAKLPCFQRGAVSMRDYHALLWNVEKSNSRDLNRVIFGNNGQKILSEIVGDWAFSHGFSKLRIESFRISKLEKKRGSAEAVEGVRPHTDRYSDGDPNDLYAFRLWIPLRDIDNLVLGVGDTNKLIDRECASIDLSKIKRSQREQCRLREEFEKVEWYHQSSMRPQDVVFFADKQVPHFSTNRGDSYRTQQRSALIVNLKFTDKKC